MIRTETVLALHTHIPYRTEPLISRLAQGSALAPAGPPRAGPVPRNPARDWIMGR